MEHTMTRRYLVTMGCAKYPVDATDRRDARRQAHALYSEQYGSYGMPITAVVEQDEAIDTAATR